MSDFLTRIAAHKRAEVAAREAARPLPLVQAAAAAAAPPRAFHAALDGPPPRLIAEVKRASPARGALNLTLEPAALACTYAAAGAHALSVLTDEQFFHGSDADLVAARTAVALPVLRKDFVLTAYQVWEARALGADAVLLIVALLPERELGALQALAHDLGMAALVEVHTPEEAAVAAAVGARLIGINNRDLTTFQVDLGTTERIAPLLPPEATVISESGIQSAADVRRVLRAGARAVLVGEALVTAGEPAARVAELLGVAVP
ncbi:MAG: indole-3-glycerol phosphate synthase TrpC [Chloroflexi bacterium]|nr:indole-3-glycerol phosphate synthase TrpC [Chloroflexota bacterium]